MANIKNELNNIKSALYGKDVRSSIHNGIDAINNEVESTTGRQVDLENTFDQLIINAGNSNAEIVDARVKNDGTSYSKLGDRLDAVDSQLEQIRAKSRVTPRERYLSETDDTIRLQEVLDNSNYIFLDEEEYYVSSITIKNYVNIAGKGREITRIIQTDNANNDMIVINDGIGKNISISNLTLLGNRANQTRENKGINCIDSIEYDKSVELYDVVVKDFKDVGLYLGENRNMFHIDKCTFTNNKQGCLISSIDGFLLNSEIPSNDYENLYLRNGTGSTFSNLNIYGSKNSCGVYIHDGCFYVCINGCHIDGNAKEGIVIEQTSSENPRRNIILTNNSFLPNSTSSYGEYSHINLKQATKGVIISSCEFWTYNSQQTVKYICEIGNNTSQNSFINNTYSTSTNKPFSKDITNDKSKIFINDDRLGVYSSNQTTVTNSNINFVSSSSNADKEIFTTKLMSEGIPNFSILANGKIKYTDGKSILGYLDVLDNNILNYDGFICGKSGLVVANHIGSDNIGSMYRKFPVFNNDGSVIGYVPVYK